MIKIGPDFYIAASQVGKAYVDDRGTLMVEEINGKCALVVTGYEESVYDELDRIVREVDAELKGPAK